MSSWYNWLKELMMIVLREGVTSYATLAATYIASFTLAQLLLKASDVGLETADSFLKWTSNEKVQHVYIEAFELVQVY